MLVAGREGDGIESRMVDLIDRHIDGNRARTVDR